MVGLRTLTPPVGVRIPLPQPNRSRLRAAFCLVAAKKVENPNREAIRFDTMSGSTVNEAGANEGVGNLIFRYSPNSLAWRFDPVC